MATFGLIIILGISICLLAFGVLIWFGARLMGSSDNGELVFAVLVALIGAIGLWYSFSHIHISIS